MTREEFWKQATARHLTNFPILLSESHAGGNAFGTVRRDHTWWIYQTNERDKVHLLSHFDTEEEALDSLLKLLGNQAHLDEWADSTLMTQVEFWNQVAVRGLGKYRIFLSESDAVSNAFGCFERDGKWNVCQTNERGTVELDEQYDTEGSALTGLLQLLEDQVLLNEWRKRGSSHEAQ